MINSFSENNIWFWQFRKWDIRFNFRLCIYYGSFIRLEKKRASLLSSNIVANPFQSCHSIKSEEINIILRLGPILCDKSQISFKIFLNYLFLIVAYILSFKIINNSRTNKTTLHSLQISFLPWYQPIYQTCFYLQEISNHQLLISIEIIWFQYY